MLNDSEKLYICERRSRFWQASALLAACGKLTVDQLLLSIVLYGLNGPTDANVDNIVEQARKAVEERGASIPKPLSMCPGR